MNRMIRNMALLFLIVGLLTTARPFEAAAQTSAPEFQSEALFTFGQTVRFRLTASATANVESVTLFFEAPEFPSTFRVRVAFSQERELEADYSVDLTQVRLSPFTTVTYWWLLTTAEGEEFTVPKQEFTYEDNQFVWHEARQEGLRIFWTGDDLTLGQVTLNIISEALPKLQAMVPDTKIYPIRIYIYPGSADLRAALRLTGRDWVGGHADPEIGVILLTSVNSGTAATDLRRTVPHELTHFMLYHAAGDNYRTLPVWFNEGLATSMEEVSNATYPVLLEEAVKDGTTIPFSEICPPFPAAEGRALLAYAQSGSLIRFIKDRYGDEKLVDLVNTFADGNDCQSGVKQVLDMTLDELERAWLRQQKAKPPAVQFVVDNGPWLLLLVAGFALSSLLFVRPTEK